MERSIRGKLHRSRGATMGDLAPVAVAIPLVTAAVLVAVTAIVPRWVIDMLAIASAIACLVLCALVLDDASDGTLVHWFGGWTPREGIALGISILDRPDRCRPGAVRIRALPRRLRLLLALLHRDRAALPRADARVPGRDARLQLHRRPVQPVRVLRADERGRVRAGCLRHRGGGAAPRELSTSRSRTASGPS